MIMRAALFCFILLFGFGKSIVFAKENRAADSPEVCSGIFGQQLFMGKMNTCNDALLFNKRDCVGQIKSSEEARIWMTFYNNFGQSVLNIYLFSL